MNRRGFLAGLLAASAVPALTAAMPPQPVAYMVFENFDLSQFEDRMPDLDLNLDERGNVVGINGWPL